MGKVSGYYSYFNIRHTFSHGSVVLSEQSNFEARLNHTGMKLPTASLDRIGHFIASKHKAPVNFLRYSFMCYFKS